LKWGAARSGRLGGGSAAFIPNSHQCAFIVAKENMR
jgi:hypothetical protein